MLHIFSEANFNKLVMESSTPVLVDFWAEWCGPCRIQGPIIEALANEVDGSKIKIGKMNADENQDLTSRFGIMSIPTLMIFKNGKVDQQLVGLRSKDEIKSIIEKYTE